MTTQLTLEELLSIEPIDRSGVWSVTARYVDLVDDKELVEEHDRSGWWNLERCAAGSVDAVRLLIYYLEWCKEMDIEWTGDEIVDLVMARRALLMVELADDGLESMALVDGELVELSEVTEELAELVKDHVSNGFCKNVNLSAWSVL